MRGAWMACTLLVGVPAAAQQVVLFNPGVGAMLISRARPMGEPVPKWTPNPPAPLSARPGGGICCRSSAVSAGARCESENGAVLGAPAADVLSRHGKPASGGADEGRISYPGIEFILDGGKQVTAICVL